MCRQACSDKKGMSALCGSCTGEKACAKEKAAWLMPYMTYCTRYDSKDKAPRLFPLLQPYEVDCLNAQYRYDIRKNKLRIGG